MINEIRSGGQPLHRVDVAAVSFLEVDSFGKVVQIAANHVVAADHVVAGANECVGKMTAQKPGDAGDENLH